MAADHADKESAMQSIKEYCFEEDGFTDTFNEWSAQNAHNIDLTMDFTENKLEYTEMHREFTALFEKRLEKRVIAEGLTVDEFYDWLKADLEEDAGSNNAFVVDLLLAMSDYGIFMQMMRQVAKDFQAKQAAAADSKAPEEDSPAASESKK